MAADRRRREELLNEKRREDAAGGRPGQETPQVVCFGMIIPAVVLVVDEFPPHNTGALVRQAQEFISDDAAIVATILRQWDVRAGLIGTALGDDERGRSAARRLQEMGVLGEVRLLPGMTTPYEVDVSDRSGARTYFWQREPEVLATLDSADLSLLKGSGMLYVDWYDGEPILRAMREARRLGVPAFLNLEHGHQDADALRRFASGATICQVVTDPAQRGGDARGVAEKLLASGSIACWSRWRGKAVWPCRAKSGCEFGRRRSRSSMAAAPARHSRPGSCWAGCEVGIWNGRRASPAPRLR